MTRKINIFDTIVARRRAVAWRIDEHRGEARYCPAVAPDERGRNRGRLPSRLLATSALSRKSVAWRATMPS